METIDSPVPAACVGSSALLGSVVCGACKYYLLARDPDTARPVHNYPGTCDIMQQIRPGFMLLPLAAYRSITKKTDATDCRFFLPNNAVSNFEAKTLDKK